MDATATPRTTRSERRRGWLRSEAGSLLLMLALLALARTTLANHYTVPTGSMEPALLPGDRVVVDMSAYGVRVPFTQLTLLPRDQPRRGDVVVLASPVDGTRLIKRVVAVGGDRVSVAGGRLSINGRVLASATEPDVEVFGGRRVALNLDQGGGPDLADLAIPRGQVLLMGDHRGASLDGRSFGLVPAQSVYARALGVYWRQGEGPVWERL